MSNPKVDQSTFLTTPSPPTCTSHPIDFSTTPLPEYTSSFALLIAHLLTPTECTQLLSLAQSTTSPPSTWSPAEINIGHGRQRMILEARNCGRIIWDSFPLAERLMSRILPHLPSEIVTLQGNGRVTGHGPVKRGETWRISRLNERLRFLKYTAGMYFREHCDGSYVTPDGREVSFLTVHLYLNGDEEAAGTGTSSSTAAGPGSGGGGSGGSGGGSSRSSSDTPSASQKDTPIPSLDPEHQPLLGGATRFFSVRALDKFVDVNPQPGACLVFQHRGLLHSGEEVESGVKYTLRSDVMYEKVEGGV